MQFKRLFMWVEGLDDERFFNAAIKQLFEKKYDLVEVRQHASLSNKQTKRFLRSIKAMRADYIYITDINHAPCVTSRKQRIKTKFSEINDAKIIVVIKEIESWFLAGLNDKMSRILKIPDFQTTDNVTKEDFDKLIPQFTSRIDFMREILKHFSIEIANQKNKSFRYFLEKHKCKV